MDVDLFNDSLGKDTEGNDVFLKDIWPSPTEVEEIIASTLTSDMFASYDDVFAGDERWQALQTPEGNAFDCDWEPTHVRTDPYIVGLPEPPTPATHIAGASVQPQLGES